LVFDKYPITELLTGLAFTRQHLETDLPVFHHQHLVNDLLVFHQAMP